MTTQNISIDPDKKDDLYYRYKMPAVITKVEGSGNGIKTVIPNIHEICLAINRPEEVMMKFFQYEIGAQRTVSAKDDKFLLMGSHTAERMQDKIYDFIRKFVLCKSCRNPETAVQLEQTRKGKSVSMVCGACGKRSHMDDHRTLLFMTQYYEKHPEEAKVAKGAAETRKGDEEPAAAETAAAAAPAPKAKAAKRATGKSDLADNRVNPAETLSNDIEKHWGKSDELIGTTIRMISSYNLPETYGPALVLAALSFKHTADLLGAMKAHARLLKRFATVPELFTQTEGYDEKVLSELLARRARIQRVLITELAKLCASQAALGPEKLPIAFFMLFVEGILVDTSLESWYKETKPSAYIKPEVEQKMKAMCEPVLQWIGIDTAVAPAAAPEAPAAAE